MTMVWLHSLSPPQHIANVAEESIRTAEKLRAYMLQTNERRAVNLKWAGAFEDARGGVSVEMFWDKEQAKRYVQRNTDLNLLISTED